MHIVNIYILIIVFTFELFLIYVSLYEFSQRPSLLHAAILSLSLPAVTCVVVMVALVNNNFQYKFIKLFVASTGLHTSIKNLCESVLQFFWLLMLIICVMSTTFISSNFTVAPPSAL